jgi:histidyl-tRNA synthetase
MPPDDTTTPGFRPKARRPRVRDRRGGVLRAERALVEKVSQVYEKWGFEPLDTAALEYADALGKFLPDQDRPNEGVFAFQDDDEQWLALRYDHTAPLARFVAENFDALPKPYRRWAAGPVWRNEKLGPGRFREFWQCDADTVGSASPAADAEMIAMACEALEAAGVKRGEYIVKYNDRRILDGILDAVAAAPSQRLTVLRAIDKLDRLGSRGVAALLGVGRKDESGDFTPGANLSDRGIAFVLEYLQCAEGDPRDALGRIQELVVTNDKVNNERLRNVYRELNELDVVLGVGPDQARFDPSIVRGLEYYTGPVYEIELLGETTDEDGKPVRIGSVGAGGRYDDLVARFRGERIPATGISIGVSRLAAALSAQEAEEDGPVVILALEADRMADYFAIARELRAKGVTAEVYLGAGRFGAQLKYADKRNAPLAIIIGGDERAAGQATIKDLKLGAQMSKNIADNEEWRRGRPAQITVPRGDLVATLLRMLSEQQDARG